MKFDHKYQISNIITSIYLWIGENGILSNPRIFKTRDYIILKHCSFTLPSLKIKYAKFHWKWIIKNNFFNLLKNEEKGIFFVTLCYFNANLRFSKP